MLLNLLENALRYTPPAAGIEISAESGDAVVKLQVVDGGPGIAEGEREKVFDAFRGSRAQKTMEASVSGSRYVVRSCVRTAGGSQFASVRGVGPWSSLPCRSLRRSRPGRVRQAR